MATLTLEAQADSEATEPEKDDLEPQLKSCAQCCSWRRCATFIRLYYKHSKTKLLVALSLGQFLSLLLCGTGVTSQLLETNFSIVVPTTQAFINYAILAAIFGVALAARSDFLSVLWKNWWRYALLGVIDVEANYLVILAYKYTNLTSIQLLDSFTIATVMALSFIFLRVRYKVINVMGVCLALVGIVSLVLADLQGSRLQHGSNPLLGDLLCLVGSLLYAVSNVAQEFLVKNHSITEYLGLLGVSGSVVAAVQLLILERTTLVRIEWNMKIGLLFAGFGVSQFLFYTVMPQVMKFSSALVVNLSLLTADFYTLFFGLFLFHYQFTILYSLSFVLIILGVFIYNLKQPTVAKMEVKLEELKKKSEKKEVTSHSSKASRTNHKDLEQRLQGMLESQSAEMSLTGCRGSSNTSPLNRPRSLSNKTYGSVDIDFEDNDHKAKRHKSLLREE